MEGATVEVRARLQLDGKLLLKAEVQLSEPVSQTQRIDLQAQQPVDVVFHFPAPPVPPEPSPQERLLAEIRDLLKRK